MRSLQWLLQCCLAPLSLCFLSAFSPLASVDIDTRLGRCGAQGQRVKCLSLRLGRREAQTQRVKYLLGRFSLRLKCQILKQRGNVGHWLRLRLSWRLGPPRAALGLASEEAARRPLAAGPAGRLGRR